MTSEPSEEAISNFVSFTSSSREQAISFLKANDLNSNKAINAYFENPPGFQPEVPSSYDGQNVPSFNIEPGPVLDSGFAAAPPSRPPSRRNMHESPNAKYGDTIDLSTANTTANSGQGLTLAEREERDLQQAMAMSLNQDFGDQESGITRTGTTNFGRATRDHYDEDNWALTLFNSSSREVIISPDPEERRRVDNEPAFIRPSQEATYLGGVLTILHSIPLAREALLMREKVLPDYGHDPQWWNGQPISLPKIVSLDDAHGCDSDLDDILYEAQRLMAFLDSTERAFGSGDAITSMGPVSSYDSDTGVTKFLETWQEAAVRATPGNQLATIFSSRALKRPLSTLDTPIEKEFVTLESFVEPEHGQTLYDVLDRTVWSDKPGEELDDVWIENLAEVLTIRLETSKQSAKSLDVKIPATFYPDRYLANCRDIARDFRSRKLEAYKKVSRLSNLMNRFAVSRAVAKKGLTSRETLEKAAAAACLALPKNLANGVSEASLTPEAANAEGQRLATELRTISEKIEEKLKELENRRQSALETLRNYSKALTEPSSSPDEPPHHKYTLRGVCTEPHIIYLLRRRVPDNPQDEADSSAGKAEDWQWWRISFSTDDAKTRRAEADQKGSSRKYAAPANADVVGYTARKVREIEVLRAAREESKSVLLVYANENAVTFPEGPLPPQLQDFVNTDNKSFEAELQEAERDSQSETLQAEEQIQPWDNNEPPPRRPFFDTTEPFYDTHSTSAPDYQGSHQYEQRMSLDEQNPSAASGVNVFDYQVSSLEDDENQGQEMQERNARGLLGSQGG